MNHAHRYPRRAWWMAIALAWPMHALAAAGLVQFSAGDVQLRRGDALGPLARGASVDGGDVILTGVSGRAQIRFTDGGLVSLYPGSQFTVERYVDSGDPAQDSFAVNLVRGGLRAVTGLIGKRQPANYKVLTPTAVVGIRGSAFRVFFNAQGEVEVGGEQDAIEVCTKAGCVGVMAGESVRVRSEQSLPVYTHTRAELPLPQPQVPYVVGNPIQRETTPPKEPDTPTVPEKPVTPQTPVTPDRPSVPTQTVPPGAAVPGSQIVPVPSDRLPTLP